MLSYFLILIGLTPIFSTSLLGQPPLQRRTIVHEFNPPEGRVVSVAFFDADSTLRISKSGNLSANGPDDYYILPGVIHKIRELNKQGYFVAIVSNQGGIPRHVSLEDANAALANMIIEMAKQQAYVHYYDFAENNDEYRKPNIGMYRLLNQLLGKTYQKEIDQRRSFMVGDAAYKMARGDSAADLRPHGDDRPVVDFSNSDRGFAENLMIRFYEPDTFFGWMDDFGVQRFEDYQHARSLTPRKVICPQSFEPKNKPSK